MTSDAEQARTAQEFSQKERKKLSRSFTFAKFLDEKMEAAFRDDLDSNTWLEEHLCLWGIVVSICDIIVKAYIIHLIVEYDAKLSSANQPIQTKHLWNQEFFLPASNTILSMCCILLLGLTNIQTSTRFHGIRWLLRCKNTLFAIWTIFAENSHRVGSSHEKYLQIYVLLQILFGHVVFREFWEHETWILLLIWGKLINYLRNVYMTLHVFHMDSATFLKTINLMEENVGVVWKTGLSLFSIAVLPRVYTTLRRNWLLRVKGPESNLNQESIIPTVSATVSEELIRGNDGYFDNDEVKSLVLLVGDEVETMKQAVKRSDSVYSLTVAGKKSNIKTWRKSDVMIGSGTYGCVYKGYDKKTKEEFAIKTTYLQGMTKSSHLIQLEHELQTLQRLSHPNIVKYKGANIIQDQLYIVMEYCQAGSLSSLLDVAGKLEEQVIRAFTRDLTEGLSYLHRHGMMHRDVKSGNCLISREGIMKLADFGASLNIKDTYRGDLQGTPGYIAPELLREKELHRQSDVWGLGCIVHEMFTLELPFDDNSDDQLKVHKLYRLSQIEEDPEIPKDISEEAREFLSSCLKIDFRKRCNTYKLAKLKFLECRNKQEETLARQRAVLAANSFQSGSGHASGGSSQDLSLPWRARIYWQVYNAIARFEGWDLTDKRMSPALRFRSWVQALQQIQRTFKYLQPPLTVMVVATIIRRPVPTTILDITRTACVLIAQVFWNWMIFSPKVDQLPPRYVRRLFTVVVYSTRMSALLLPYISWDWYEATSVIFILCTASFGILFPTTLECWFWILFFSSLRIARTIQNFLQEIRGVAVLKDGQVSTEFAICAEDTVMRLGVIASATVASLYLSRTWRIEDRILLRKAIANPSYRRSQAAQRIGEEEEEEETDKEK
mmetsp:Transcript_17884/g.58790  ORF Transcript_17884/g.58790 Transcript_17884/m.58790 type:complete len:891 (-) Transcript_17884:26-2698(-)